MVNILLITGLHINASNPNANCVKEIVQELLKYEDICLKIISADEHPLEPINTGRFKNWLNTFLRIAYWPSVDTSIIFDRFNKAQEAYNIKQYDFIIAVHKPYEALYAAYKMLKKNKKAKLIIYELDPIANEIDSKIGKSRYLFFLTKHSEMKMFKNADHIFHMECNRKSFSLPKYKKFKEKSSFLDFPLVKPIVPKKVQNEKNNDSYSIKMIYSGMLDKTVRSPEYLLQVLDAFDAVEDIDVYFYTRGNCKDLLLEMEKHCSYLHVSDYIPKYELDQKIADSDFLINISNKYSDMLPSKILTYISTGKPIIHISNQNNDACIDYFKRYDNCLIIYEKDSVEESTEKLRRFIGTNYGKFIDPDCIVKQFEKNTPQYSARIIHDYCVDKKEFNADAENND